MTPSELASKLTNELADQGRIVEGGWRAYELLTGLTNAPEVQRHECRKAYFLGAQHLFASIMQCLDPDSEPTERDMERVSKIDDELKRFVRELKAKSN